MKLKVSEETAEMLKELNRAILDETGVYEMGNPTPMVVHVNKERPLTLKEQIQRCMRGLSQDMAAQGQETYDEANDFDVPEDDGPELSPYQVQGMTPDWPARGPGDPSPLVDDSADPADTPPDTEENQNVGATEEQS